MAARPPGNVVHRPIHGVQGGFAHPCLGGNLGRALQAALDRADVCGPERAHSVARSENPHADSKLSTASGLTQEILHETLAEGKPGPSRKVADTQD